MTDTLTAPTSSKGTGTMTTLPDAKLYIDG